MIGDCLDCIRQVTLTQHGRCPWCGSNAIAPSTGTNFENLRAELKRQQEINDLVTMFYRPDQRKSA